MAMPAPFLGWVLNEADDDDLNRLAELAKQRRQTLATARAASLAVGETVRIENISPKALNGCVGTVTAVVNKRVTVKLDETSTEAVRWARTTKIRVPADCKEYEVGGIPVQCVIPVVAS